MNRPDDVFIVHSREYPKLLKLYFKHTPSDYPTIIFGIRVDDIVVGYVCIDYNNDVGIIHLGMKDKHKAYHVLVQMPYFFEIYLSPKLEDLGLKTITTTCQQEDSGTLRMMRAIGMDVSFIAHGTKQIT